MEKFIKNIHINASGQDDNLLNFYYQTLIQDFKDKFSII
tara:strand:+ start:34 stop:150 length:117 start_codon:yes stop_codon:yes gene_type:complete